MSVEELAPPPCRVLVVEDSEEMAVVIERILARAGFQVVAAPTGAAALAEWTRGGVDLALIDLGLPDISGEALFAEIQRRAPSFPCVFLTANNSIDKAVDLMRIGALDYIVKPIEREHFSVRMSTVRERILSTRELVALRQIFTPSEPLRSTAFVGGQDPKMLALLKRVTLAARTEAPVMISGESGTGKELVARAVHQLSRRGNGPFVAVNTAAISVSLWESEFFGHVKGAFTDARSDAPGLIAAAEKGTLFLDEVGEIPLAAQAKLLRFIQERQYRPVGSTRETTADTRIVAATHRDLKKLVAKGEFREDLYYRLHVVPIDVPALRDRRGDIPMLAQHFLARYSREFDVPVQGFTPSALARLLQYDWPGNVRELENLIQQIVAVATGALIQANDVPLPSNEFVSLAETKDASGPTDAGIEALATARLGALREFERNYLTRVLTLTEGNITRAAALCKVPRKTLWRLLKANEIIAVREGVPSKPGRPRSPAR